MISDAKLKVTKEIGQPKRNLKRPGRPSDKEGMEPQTLPSTGPLISENLAPMQLSAFTVEEQQVLLRYLPGALVAAGGWLLRQEVLKPGRTRIIFEFERSAAMDIYVMLVGVGLELSRSSHLLMTSFWQRTVSMTRSEAVQVATCELEICELLEETSTGEPLFCQNASA